MKNVLLVLGFLIVIGLILLFKMTNEQDSRNVTNHVSNQINDLSSSANLKKDQLKEKIQKTFDEEKHINIEAPIHNELLLGSSEIEINEKPRAIDNYESTKCIIHYGKPKTKACDKFKNIEKMDLTRFANLELNDSVTQMYENSKYNQLLDITSFELGKSDEGAVYQFILLNYYDENQEELDSFFFDYKLENSAYIVSEGEFKFEPFESENGFKFVEQKFNNSMRTLSFYEIGGAENFYGCIEPKKYDFYKYYEIQLPDLELCNRSDLFPIYNLYLKDVVIDGGGLLINDSVIRSCINFEDKNHYLIPIEINPLVITEFRCRSLKRANAELLKEFKNIETISVEELDDDLSFLTSYSNLKSLIIRGKMDFDINWLSNSTKLKELVLNNVNILNIDQFTFESPILESLDFSNSTFENLEFLKYQYNLKHLALKNTNLQSLPLLGSGNDLISLNLSNNQLTNLDGVEQYVNLKDLNVRKNNIQYMSNLDLNNGVWQSINITFNPLDCTDPNLEYASFVKSACNRQLEPN